MRWKTAEKPSIRFSNSGSSASGVTSRPVKPVPPVVITASIAGSAIQPRTLAPIGPHRARFVLVQRARVRDGEDGEADREECTLLGDFRHETVPYDAPVTLAA